MVEKQVVGCDVPVEDEMPIGTLLRAVGQRGFDGNIPPNLGFDDHMLDSVLLEDQVVVQLVGRAVVILTGFLLMGS